MKFFRISCLFFIISFYAISAAFANIINIHISDFGIEQHWNDRMKVGNNFTILQNSKNSHNQVHSDMHDMVKQVLDDKAKSQVLIPMPKDEIMNSSLDIEERIYQDLKATMEKAIENGNRDFEFQLVQNIDVGGYFNSENQKMVTKFGNAAYGAVARLTNELRKEHTCALDATVGSNGTVMLGRSVEKLRSVSDSFRRLDFVDGRASYEEMNDVIDVFGASKINITNTHRDYWGLSIGSKPSISNHRTSKRLLRENPMINYEWIEAVDPLATPHVRRMTKPDAKFKVRRFYVDGKHQLATYDVPIPLTGREIRQIWGASDKYSQMHQRPVSFVIANRVRHLENGYAVARSIASTIPRNSKVVYLESHKDQNTTKHLISAKVTPENLVTLSRKGSDVDLFKELKRLNVDFVITFDNEAPNFSLPNTMYVVGENTFNAFRSMTELYADLLDYFEMLSSGEQKKVKALGWTGHLERVVKAIERDQKKGISLGPVRIISSDTLYEVTKIFTSESFKSFAKVVEKAPNPKINEGFLLTKTRELAGKPGKAVNLHASSSIMDASFVIADAIQEGRAPFTGNELQKADDIQGFAKAGVGGLSYALGFSMSGGITAVAGGFETIGTAVAELTDYVSLKIFTHMVVNEKEYSDNVQQLLDFWGQQQERRIKNGKNIQRVEDYFGRDNLKAMGLSSRDIQKLNNSTIHKAFGIQGALKEYSVRRYHDVYGNTTNVQRLIYEAENKSGSHTKTIKTNIVSQQYRNGQLENAKIQMAMNAESSKIRPESILEKKHGGVYNESELKRVGTVDNHVNDKIIDDKPSENLRSWQVDLPTGIE